MTLLKEEKILVVGTATGLEEALAWQTLGADAVCLQGIEAGGHRGSFLSDQANGLDLSNLLQICRNPIRLPIIAAGAIMDGHGIRRALAQGADLVQMGTAFLSCAEAGTHVAHRQALLQAKPGDSCLTRAFSGRYARGLRNRFIDLMQAHENLVPNYPIQNALTGSIRAHASANSNAEYMSLWAGQGAHLSRALSVAELFRALLSEWREAQA